MKKIKVSVQVKDFDIVDLNNLGSHNVTMSNVIVRSAQTLSLIEKRILMACISKMKDRTVKLSATEYANTYNVDLKNAYQHLKDGSTNLFNRYLSVNVKDGKSIGVMRIRWLSTSGYFDGEGYVTMGFAPEIMPHLINLKGQFTQYQLKQAADLRSLHSWRLLELLEQMRNDQPEGYLLISITDFHHAMEASESYKTNFSLLRQYVIEPAIKELNEKDGWAIEYIPLKRGRKVAALRFDFVKNKQLSLIQQGDPSLKNFVPKLKSPKAQPLHDYDESNWKPA